MNDTATVSQNTTDIPSNIIAAIAALVAPPGCGRFELRVTRAPTRKGSSGVFHVRSNVIGLRVGSIEESYVTRGRAARGYLEGIAIGSRAESVLYVLAHELRHRWQKNNRHPRVFGSRGRYSERDADAYALSVLRRYRRNEIVGLAELVAQIPKGETARAALERVNVAEAKRAADPFADLPKRARRYAPQGASVDGDMIDAPPGFVWSATGSHSIMIADDLEDLISDLKCGVEPCASPECDTCEDRRAA